MKYPSASTTTRNRINSEPVNICAEDVFVFVVQKRDKIVKIHILKEFITKKVNIKRA
jgi:hypothetical protein